jgi:hypothetical protein
MGGAAPTGDTLDVDSGRGGSDQRQESSSSDDPRPPDISGDEQAIGWGDDPEEQDRDAEW